MTKTKGKIRRTLAAALAAVMMMSTAATFAASAADTQAVVNMNTSTAVTQAEKDGAIFKLDDDLLKFKDVSAQTIFNALEKFTTYGKLFTPALSAVVDLVFGAQPDPTQQKLDEINDKIDKLFERIDKVQNELVNSFGNQLGIQSFYDTFVSFKSQIQSMKRKISEISKDKSLTMLDKIAKIGSLAGDYSEWDTKFENTLGKLNELIRKPSFTQDGNIFELSYNHFCSQSMFSGEALDKAKPLCDALMQVYIAGVTTITKCLSAQLYVGRLPDEYKSKISSEYMSHICLNSNDIENEIKSINEYTANPSKTLSYFEGKPVKYFNGTGGITLPADSDVKHNVDKYNPNRDYYYVITGPNTFIKVKPVYYTDAELAAIRSSSKLFKDMYDATFEQSGRILVNKNPNGSGYQVSDKLNWFSHGDNPYNNGVYTDCKATSSVSWFDNEAAKKQISFDDIKAMASYCRDKGITIRSLLNSVGIDTSAVARNANIITSKGIDETDDYYKASFTGVLYSNGYYMGINIDQVGAGEQKTEFIDDGSNFWKQEEWAWAPAGTFCWLSK